MEYSQNKRAEELVGKRDLLDNAIPFDQPCELGYHCPVCEYPQITRGWDERLEWSEYNGFLWCSVCNKDYPSCICIPLDKDLPGYMVEKYNLSAVDYAIKVFLDCIEDANKMISIGGMTSNNERKES